MKSFAPYASLRSIYTFISSAVLILCLGLSDVGLRFRHHYSLVCCFPNTVNGKSKVDEYEQRVTKLLGLGDRNAKRVFFFFFFPGRSRNAPIGMPFTLNCSVKGNVLTLPGERKHPVCCRSSCVLWYWREYELPGLLSAGFHWTSG